ncbi:hypothetical protein CQ017_04980 [Arthrobacter sp. MYb224]|uniref:hypothetical protein n=1 Tax=Arthrobacter sp. MYb224 TaxID=1848600 RepID=UPI000CFD4D68|nr:hypothetical protein [Arthrobacter sp. MYb224]PRA00383.1 hypothetical protein CQ017_04980 [Arthrobacter sp. MYb224]
MTRPFAAVRSLPRFGALLLPLLALLALLALPLPAQAQDLRSEPVYPTVQSSAPAQDEEPIRIPRVTAQQENFYLAVSDAAQDSVDTQEILDQVRQSMDLSNAKILVGVDRKPNNLTGAAQLVRGLLLFGDSDALSDDWVENGQELGYVGKGWIVVGVMLPEAPGAPTEVSVEPGRNVTPVGSGAEDRIQRAGRQQFDAQNYSQGLIEVARASATELKAPKDSTTAKIIGFGVLGLIVVGAVLATLIARHRKNRAAAAMARSKRGDMLVELLRQRALRLEKDGARPAAGNPEGPSAQASTAIKTAIPPLNARARQLAEQYQDGGPLGADRLATMESAFADQEVLVAGSKALNSLLGSKFRNKDDWNAIVLTHRERLEDTAQFLNIPSVGQLECVPRLRALIIEHTNRLDEMRQWAGGSQQRNQTTAQVLDELWIMHQELQREHAAAVQQASAANLKLIDSLRERMLGDRAAKVCSDPLSILDRAYARAEELAVVKQQENS